MEDWSFNKEMVAGDMFVLTDSPTMQLTWHVNSWDMTEAITIQKGISCHLINDQKILLCITS